MVDLAALARRLGLRRGAASPGPYTRELVLLYMQSRLPSARAAEEIRRMLETLPALVREPAFQRHYQGFQRYLEVLPRILYLYLRGRDPAQIAAGLGFLATDYGVETVVEITAQVIAERLNAESLNAA